MLDQEVAGFERVYRIRLAAQERLMAEGNVSEAVSRASDHLHEYESLAGASAGWYEREHSQRALKFRNAYEDLAWRAQLRFNELSGCLERSRQRARVGAACGPRLQLAPGDWLVGIKADQFSLN